MLNEIFEIVAKKHKLPVEQIRLCYKSTTDAIRYYITNPLISKTVIRIMNLGSFKMTDRSVRNHNKKDLIPELTNYKQQFKRKKNNERQETR